MHHIPCHCGAPDFGGTGDPFSGSNAPREAGSSFDCTPADATDAQTLQIAGWLQPRLGCRRESVPYQSGFCGHITRRHETEGGSKMHATGAPSLECGARDVTRGVLCCTWLSRPRRSKASVCRALCRRLLHDGLQRPAERPRDVAEAPSRSVPSSKRRGRLCGSVC